jgi:2-phospho-L-lactate guanylyltransferase
VEIVVVLPVKPLSAAKSRLRAGYGPGTDALALAMALDVIAAASAAGPVGAVAIVTSDDVVAEAAAELGARTVPDAPAQGLNAALRWAAGQLLAEQPDRALIVQPADCPAVTPDDFAGLAGELTQAGPRLFVSDRAGTGTTALAAPPGVPLEPRYGPTSRADHLASGARELSGRRWARVRADVDTPSDLAAASSLGLGPRTREWVERRPD